MARYWLIVASRNHVYRGLEGGFSQANHGKLGPLKRMQPGDGVVYYSPKMEYGGDEPCQRFTAIGRVAEGEPYQVVMSDTFAPFRRNVVFAQAHEADIRVLLPQLDFISDKQHWGAVFRFGFREIPVADYERIAEAMGVG